MTYEKCCLGKPEQHFSIAISMLEHGAQVFSE